jgi:glycerophosphoryl diester phosphodiesterase
VREIDPRAKYYPNRISGTLSLNPRQEKPVMAAIICRTTAAKAFGVMALALVLNGGAMNREALAFDIEAHRGGRALFPENTLQSFANALSIGVNTLELDIGVTRDSAIIVSHERKLNPDLARGADGAYVTPPGTPFVQLNLDQVKQYDVGRIRPGSAYAAQFPDQQTVTGTRIPTLSEVFELVRRSRDSQVRFNIETKIDPNHPDESPDPQHFVSLLLNLLRTEQMTDRVTVQSFDWRTLLLVQQQAPSIPTVYLTQQAGLGATIALDKATEWTAGFNPGDYGKSLPRAIKAAGGAIWSPYFRDVDAELIAEAHQLGLKVVVWTVNKPEEIARMIEIGVDGVISDRPDLLRKVADEKGIALPGGHPIRP